MTEWDASAYHRESSLQSWLAGQSLAAVTSPLDERAGGASMASPTRARR